MEMFNLQEIIRKAFQLIQDISATNMSFTIRIKWLTWVKVFNSLRNGLMVSFIYIKKTS